MAATPDPDKMTYNFLGKSGLKVSSICLGTMTFGENQQNRPGQSNEELSHEILDRFVAWGGSFVDTADFYGWGKSETIVGTWLTKQTRENVVVATKCGLTMPGGNNYTGLSRRHIIASVEGSLKRLQTDYIDLYQTHIFDAGTPIAETYRTLDDLVRCGKIRYVGVSNVSGWQLQKIVDTQEKLGMNPIVSLQQQYSLACREPELEPFQVCKTEGIGVLPWSPLKGGFLTGKVRRGIKPTEGRVGWLAEDEKRALIAAPDWADANEKVFDVIDAAEEIGKKHGKSIAQVCLRWTLQKDVVNSIIVGSTKIEQLDQNMAVNGWRLSLEEMQKLDELSAPSLPYPYDLISKINAGRVNRNAHDFFVKSQS